MNRIEEIKERAAKVSGDPWKAGEYSTDYYLQGYKVLTDKGGVIAECVENEDHVAFIANAPTDVQYLLAKLEIAEKALNKVIYSKLANPNVTADDVIKIADEGLAEFYKAIRE